MASPDEKRCPANYSNLVGVVAFIWISVLVVAVQALHDDATGNGFKAYRTATVGTCAMNSLKGNQILD